MSEATPLLRVRDLTKSYSGGRGRGRTQVVRGVSFDVMPGETVGLVGESGCGKSTTARCILRLIEPDGGQVELDGIDVLGLGPGKLRELRRRMQIVFQDPYGSLDPRLSVRALVEEPLVVHGERDAEVRRRKVDEMLELVGISSAQSARNPHAFSGGQRQRIAVARALVLQPDLVLLDEPVTALDVSVQAQVLNLLDDLQCRLGLSSVFIVHDLAVAQHVCHRIAVMYRGQIVELAPTAELFARPRHPYTNALMEAAPIPDPEVMADRRSRGEVARYKPADEGEAPAVLQEVAPGHWVATEESSTHTNEVQLS